MKLIKISLYTLSAAFMLWLMLSFVDIVSDNCDPNPTHHPYNAFVLMGDKQEENGVVYSIEDNTITFMTDTGDFLTAEVDNPNEFDIDRYYHLYFQNEKIIKAFQEVW